MSTHRHIDLLCIAAVLLALVLTALFCCGQALGIGILSDEDTGDGQFTKNDWNSDWDPSGATRITLAGTDGRVSGNGAYIVDGDVHIVYAGRYVLSGDLTDGSIIVDADGDDKVWLLLDGVSVHCSDGAALRVEQAKKVFLTLAAGTENTFSDGGTYSEALTESGVDGAVYSRDDLTINGSGALTVNGTYRHGIVCNDDFVITGGTITVTAAKDGIHANDSVRFTSADLTVSAGDDGITVSNDEGTGYLYIESGRISIPACYEGLEAVSVTIDGGAIDIVSTDDGINASGRGDGAVICINGGTIKIVNPTGRDADGLDSNGDIFINGGEVFISVNGSGGSTAIDYGSENGGSCRISGGTVLACGGSAMLEAIDPDSPQAFLMHLASGAADTDIALSDADGTVLLSATVPCPFSAVIFSTPAMRLGDSCTVTVGETSESVVLDNSSAAAGGMFGGGFGGFGGMHGQDGRGEHGGRDTWAENEGGMPALPGGMEDGEGLPEMPGGGGFGEKAPESPGGGSPGENAPEPPAGGGPGENAPEPPAGDRPGENAPEPPAGGGLGYGMTETPGDGEPADGMPGMAEGGVPAEGVPERMSGQGTESSRPGMQFGEGTDAPDGFAPDDAPNDFAPNDAPDGFGDPNEPMPGGEPGAESPFPQGDAAERPTDPAQTPELDGDKLPETGEQRPENSDMQGGGFGGFGGMDMDGGRGMDGESGRGTDGGRENRLPGQLQTPGTSQNAPNENTAGPNSAALPLVGVSALVLLLGLLFAAKTKGKYE